MDNKLKKRLNLEELQYLFENTVEQRDTNKFCINTDTHTLSTSRIQKSHGKNLIPNLQNPPLCM